MRWWDLPAQPITNCGTSLAENDLMSRHDVPRISLVRVSRTATPLPIPPKNLHLHYYHLRSECGIVFNDVRCMCLSVCLSVNTITHEPLEISSRNFRESFYGRKSGQI